VHVRRLAVGLVEGGACVHVLTHKPAEIQGATVERFRVPLASISNPRRWASRRVRYLESFFDRFDVMNIHFLHDWGLTAEMLDRGNLIVTAWGSDVVPPPGEDSPSNELIEARRTMIRRAASVTACGPSFAKVVADFGGVAPDAVEVVPFGVDIRRFRRRECGAPPPSPRVGFFKGFREVYGAKYLIEAIPLILERCPDTLFELVGDGPQLGFCQALARELDLNHAILWLHRQPHDRIPALLARWDVAVIPSMFEAFGVAALEAAAAGVPVVASDVGGLRDTVRPTVTGLLVPAGNPAAIADGVATLLLDDDLRRRMGDTGRKLVEETYEEHQVLSQWMGLYERVATGAALIV
jgi:glycosyltransferase involved in cell wall biosynthesis